MLAKAQPDPSDRTKIINQNASSHRNFHFGPTFALTWGLSAIAEGGCEALLTFLFATYNAKLQKQISISIFIGNIGFENCQKLAGSIGKISTDLKCETMKLKLNANKTGTRRPTSRYYHLISKFSKMRPYLTIFVTEPRDGTFGW